MEVNEILVILMFGMFILLLFTGFPVAWVLCGISLVFVPIAMLADEWFDAFIGIDWNYASLVVPRMWDIMTNWVLVALPMFIFMGLMLDRSGTAEDLMGNLVRLFGRVRGGLAVTVTFVGLLLAASTGIIGASVVLLAVLGMPMMMRDGYSKELACGTVASTGTLGILVPPSIMLVMMGDRIGISVGDLFLGAVFPGIMLAAFYVTYILSLGYLRADAAPVSKDAEPISLPVVLSALSAALPTATLIIAVLGSIFMGIATPTEASGVGALGATLLAAARGKLTLQVLREVGRETTKTTAFIFALIICATAFSLILRGLGGDELIEKALTSLPFGPEGIVIAILVVTFLLGFFLDWIELTLIILPLVAPVVSAMGFDLVWFAVLFAVCLQTSFLTPPVGFALFYLKGVVPKGINLIHIYRGVMPFILLQLIGLGIVFWMPAIVTWLPNVVYSP
ncbi:C4-dicarboxylate ABC transporter [Grimontia hollisae]|uniref:TRAP transporter large permease protein n=1 Tax=Grimontia hollisae CIP 101886 TaxID=675812 RepID=D0I637_GRIHO|nr:TRAP transporter large permease subunit [Grimontia hollisae]AMG29064.1 C4-dicarboxylate ABC transporter [Grimontia hollisae]EEY73351.1 TRAP-type mannitol/chloroaromatic compound transport system large permease component [Grimontia hollisae CIP 101886]MDF2186647.1 TRAP transporter large permease subunit [Grimontia hollisae]STO76968.1 Neu5Ac permease [Grimontia hollisae]